MTKKLIAKTRTGQYAGFEDENGVSTFLGIRYVKPPKRWERAVELDDSDTLISAKDYSPACWQPFLWGEFETEPPMSEDCLTLNVWSDDIDVKGKPVMVWIHGGSYICGSNRMDDFGGVYCGDRIVAKNKDIVFVNINYRINAFGSLDLRDFDEVKYKDSANLQTWDQTMALKWIKENIEAFGGDPENITIFGQSAGGVSVATLMCSPIANKYFNKVIDESSAVDTSQKNDEQSKKLTKMFMEATGADTLEKLLSLDPRDILKGVEVLQEQPFSPSFNPMGDDELVTAKPLQALRNGIAKHIDLMTGTVSGEFDAMMTPMDDVTKEVICKMAYPDGISDDVIKEYLHNYPDRSSHIGYMDLMNDALRVGQVACAEAQAASNDNVYMYYIPHMTEGSKIRPQHCFEMPYVFDKIDSLVYIDPDQEPAQGVTPTREMQQRIQGCWLEFARKGNPNGKHLPVEWAKFTEANNETMYIDYDWEMKEGVRMKDTELVKPLFLRNGDF